MAKKLYVGNLGYNVTADMLRDLFATVGEVASATIITDRMSNLSRGFGFVEMGTDQAAQEAISKLNGQELQERRITVAEARPPRQDRGGPGSDDRGGRGGPDRDKRY
jgi:RNA recognition motif-containing protein